MRSEECEYLDYLHNLVLAALEHLKLGNDGEAWMHLRILKSATDTEGMEALKAHIKRLQAKATAHRRLTEKHDEIMASWSHGDTAADVIRKLELRGQAADRKTIITHIKNYHLFAIGRAWSRGDTAEDLQRKLDAGGEPVDLETLRELLPQFIELRGGDDDE